MANFVPSILEASPTYHDVDLREGGVAIISLSERSCARLMCICEHGFRSVSGQDNVYGRDIKYTLANRIDIASGATWARIGQHPDHDDLCMAHYSDAGGAGRDALCESLGGIMHETPSTLGTRLLFMGNLLASSAPSSSEAPTNTSQVLPTPCRCLSRAFMRVCIETLPLREAQFL